MPRKMRPFAPRPEIRKTLFEDRELGESSLSRSQREAGPTRLLFSSFVICDNKKGDKLKRREL